jgi:uncharacterized delta-60 repeat protein
MRPAPHHPQRSTVDLTRSPARRRLLTIAVLAIAPLVGALAAAAPAQARAFGLDPSFGDGGTVHTDFADFNDEAWALVVQDGKPIVAGSAGRVVNGLGVTDFGLARYTTDGRLDPSFGSGGKVTTDFTGTSDFAFALVEQPNGGLVAAGSTYSEDGGLPDFALARYRRDGTLDPTFGTGGKVRTDFGGTFDVAKAIVRQPNGKIVVAGNTSEYTVSNDFALARYNADGTLDTSFGVGGKVVTTFGGFSEAKALVLQNDGKIVAAGENSVEGFDFALARYHPNGRLDTSFGGDGLVITDFGGGDRADALTIDITGRIVAAGVAGGADGMGSALALARYRGDGSLDRSFGIGGKVTTSVANDTVATSVIAQGNKLLVGGSGNALTLARYQRDGSLDRSFGTDGVYSTWLGSDLAHISALALDRRGRVVAGGILLTGPYYWGNFLVARFR